MTVAELPDSSHPVDRVPPPGRLGVLGLQHVLVMYAGTVAVPLIVGGALGLSERTIAFLVNADLFVAGIATTIQATGLGRLLGVRLPVVAGATFVAVGPMIAIGESFGLQSVYGAMIASGVFGLLFAWPFSKILRFFPPLVTGTVITIIGLSLVGAAVGLIAGDDPSAPGYALPGHLAIGAGVLAFILLVHRLTSGFLSQVAVLLGLIGGTAVLVPFGGVDFSSVGTAGWFGLTTPLRFGPPEFHAAAIISMCIVMLVTFTESTADMLAVGEMVDRRPDDRGIARGLATDGLSAVLAGFFNSFPDTAFAQNVGLVGLTRVRSRWVVTVAGVILTVLGLIPKLGAIVASIPEPVIGGAALIMFGMVSAVGIRTLGRIEFDGTNNLLVVATALAVGLVPVVAPEIYRNMPQAFQLVFGSAITSTAILVFVLNLVFNELRLKPWHPDQAPPSEATTGTGAESVPP